MNSKNQEPFKYMFNNIDVIINFLSKSKSASEAWKKLSTELPDLKCCMKFNTFKVYSKILAIVSFHINNYKNLIIELKKENKELMKNIDAFNARELNLKFRLNEAYKNEQENLCLTNKVRHELDKIFLENSVVKKELDEVRHELDKISLENSVVKKELDELRHELDKIFLENSVVKKELDKVRHELGKISLKNSVVKKELDKVRQNLCDKINESSQLKIQLDSILKVKYEIHFELTEVIHKMNKIFTEESNVKAELDKVKIKLSRLVKSQDSNRVEDRVIKRINGWGVQFKYPYYRIFKKINGKVKWIYIGKKFSNELALSKIEKFFKDTENNISNN